MNTLPQIASAPLSGPGEPRLTYHPATDRWSGEDSTMSLWMSDATFQIYVRAYCDGTYGTWPTSQQQQVATWHCQRMAYWHGCERNRDLDVHVIKKGVRRV